MSEDKKIATNEMMIAVRDEFPDNPLKQLFRLMQYENSDWGIGEDSDSYTDEELAIMLVEQLDDRRKTHLDLTRRVIRQIVFGVRINDQKNEEEIYETLSRAVPKIFPNSMKVKKLSGREVIRTVWTFFQRFPVAS